MLTIETMSQPLNPLDLFQGWLSLYSDLEVLSSRHCLWLTSLNFDHNWSDLSDEEKATIPYAQEIQRLETEMRTLSNQLEATLPLVAAMTANCPKALAAKLKVIQQEVCPAEHPEVHALIASAVRDAARVAKVARG